MAAPYSDLQNKLEAACKTVAESVSLANRGNAGVYKGQGNDDLPLPRIVCMAGSGDEFPHDCGNFNMRVSVEVLSAADPKTAATLTAHRSRAAHVFDAFMADDLAAQLSAAAADFHCFGVFNRAVQAEREQERHWISSVEFTAYCRPSDMAP